MSMKQTQKKAHAAKEEAPGCPREVQAIEIRVGDKDGLWGSMRVNEATPEAAKASVLREIRRMVESGETELDLATVTLEYLKETVEQAPDQTPVADGKPTGLRTAPNKHWRESFEASDAGRDLRALRGEPEPVDAPEGPSGGLEVAQDGPRILAGLADLCDHLGADGPGDLCRTIYRMTECGASLSLYYEDGFTLHNGDSAAGRWKEGLGTHEMNDGITWENPGTPYGFSIQTIVEGSDATVDGDVFQFPVSSQEVDDWIAEMESRASVLWLEANGSPVEIELALATSIPSDDLAATLSDAIDSQISLDDEPFDCLHPRVGEPVQKGDFQALMVNMTVGWETEEEIKAFFERVVKSLAQEDEIAIASIVVTKREEDEESDDDGDETFE